MSKDTALLATLRGDAPDLDLGATIPQATVDGALTPADATSTRTLSPRTTVLPQKGRETTESEASERARFERVRTLGEGGMGEVALVRDHDIHRTVAVKRLRAGAVSREALLRFADEVRIVGQLEHPSIVPVYDVGRDEGGELYLVMKHLDGETLEQIIERLALGEPAYVAKYTIEYRVQIFIAILDAIRYAHAHGVLHRDIKPANVMVGPYGEVTVLDWGIAKPLRPRDAKAAPDVAQSLASTLPDAGGRLQQTQHGTLAGTPLYMSPEQAAGRNDELDERSDVYSLCVVFYELLALRHPLADKKTLTEALAATIHGLDGLKLRHDALQAGVPGEWVHLLGRGLRRDIDARFQSVDELENEIRGVLAGRIRVQCHVTLTKRVVQTSVRWIDRHPNLFTGMFFTTTAALLAGVVTAVLHAVR